MRPRTAALAFVAAVAAAGAVAFLHLALPLPWRQWALIPLAVAASGPAGLLLLRPHLARAADARLRDAATALPVLAGAFVLHQVLQVASVAPQPDQLPTYTAVLDTNVAVLAAFAAALFATGAPLDARARRVALVVAAAAFPLVLLRVGGVPLGWATFALQAWAAWRLARGSGEAASAAPGAAAA